MLVAVKWDDVRILLGLLRSGSLHDAAFHLELDRSTISRRVAALENMLGTPLFVRARDGLRPTAAAERLRVHAERMELESVQLASAARGPATRVAGVVRVATTEGLAVMLATEGIGALKDEHPDLVIELLGGNRPLDLLRGEADIALRVAAVRHASLRVRCLARNGVGLFASPGYLRTRGAASSVRALRGHDVLLPSAELARLPEVRWLVKQRLRVVFQSNSMLALIAAAVGGLGLAPLPLGWGKRQPGLELAMTLDHVPARPLWLVTAGEPSPPVRVVADRIAAILGATGR
jgi:DNA-binding transcriptional LysR family regulator